MPIETRLPTETRRQVETPVETGMPTGVPGSTRMPIDPVSVSRRALVGLRRDPARVIAGLLVLVLLYLVVAPLISVLSSAVRVQFADVGRTGLAEGQFTWYYLERVFASPVSELLLWQPLLHTLEVAAGTVVVAVSVGTLLAWLVERTDLGLHRILSAALVLPFIVPSWALAEVWLTVFRNRNVGGELGLLEGLGFAPPDWLAFGALPIILVLGTHFCPFVALLVGAALRQQDGQLDEAAALLGARPRGVFGLITVPLTTPAIASAALLVFAQSVGDFGTAYLLGLPGHYDTVATSLFSSLHSDSQGVAAVLTAVIVIVGVLAVTVETRLSRDIRRFAALRSVGRPQRRVALRGWRPAAIGVAFAFVLAACVLPLLILALSTVTNIPGDIGSGLTLQYWTGEHLNSEGFTHGLLVGDELLGATWRSLQVVVVAAVVCGVLGLLVGYAVTRSSGRRIAAVLRQLTFLPYLVPGVGMAIAFLTLFAVQRGPIPPLYGTLTLLVIAMVVVHLPYSSRAGMASMAQLGKDVEEAARVQGGSWWGSMWRIVVPMQTKALINGVTLPFISGLKELSLVIILTTSGAELLPTLAVRLQDEGYVQLANGVTLIIVVIASLGTWLLTRASGGRLALGLEN